MHNCSNTCVFTGTSPAISAVGVISVLSLFGRPGSNLSISNETPLTSISMHNKNFDNYFSIKPLPLFIQEVPSMKQSIVLEQLFFAWSKAN